jgi:hypothetical protein
MLIFKRKEVYMGPSVKEYTEVRKKLADARIPYDIRVVSRFGMGGAASFSRSMVNSMDGRTEYMNLCYVYVNKKDYDRAMEVLNKK